MSLGDRLLEESRKLDDKALVRQLAELTGRERATVVRVLARLSVMDERELDKELGFPSLFIFCVRRLRYCEGTAFNRSQAARACGRFPELLDWIETGELSVAAVAALTPALTRANWRSLARQARGKTRREVLRLVAAEKPCVPPPRAERVRFVTVHSSQGAPAATVTLPAGKAAQPRLPLEPSAPDEAGRSQLPLAPSAPESGQGAPAAPGPGQASTGAPAAAEVYAVRTIHCSPEVERLIRRAKELLWHKQPAGKVEDILREALRVLVERLESGKRARRPAQAPRKSRSRRVPNWVKAEVDRRDGDQCAFVGVDGQRCPERSGLEYDHIVPWALGGPSDDPGNIRKCCFSHNQWRAKKPFSPGRQRQQGGAATDPASSLELRRS